MQWLVLLALLLATGRSFYCYPYCTTNSACVGTYDGCSGCLAPFLLNANSSGCYLAPVSQSLLASELPSASSFSFSGYSSNAALSSASCSDGNTYHMLGPFAVNRYLYKEYSGLGTGHFRVDVFWSYGLFGGWANQALSAIFTDGAGAVTMQANQGQLCATSTALAGCSGSVGCFNSKTQAITHSSDFLSLNFSSMGSAMTASLTWAVSNLAVVLSLCDPTCLTCSGAAATNCLSCAAGLFLQGSVCILSCPYYTMTSSRECLTSCPALYFSNPYNSACELCPTGCLACSDAASCLSWQDGQDPSSFLFDLLPLWVLLGVLGATLMAVLLWRACCGSKSFADRMEEEVMDQQPQLAKEQSKQEINRSEGTMEARWLDDIDDLHMTKGNLQPVRGRTAEASAIQGIGKSTL
jgi:hypothetical protein